MKLALRTVHLRLTSAVEEEIRRRIAALDDLGQVLTAHVVLSRSCEGHPPFRVAVQLAVPGPDLHAVADDHTPMAALLKVERDLRQQIALRFGRRLHNRKDRRWVRRIPVNLR